MIIANNFWCAEREYTYTQSTRPLRWGVRLVIEPRAGSFLDIVKPFKNRARSSISKWCAERESNPHVFWTRDFKSLASTYSAIRAQ